MAGASIVAILTRAPAAGGKSRLFAALGRPCDPALLEALLLDTLEGARLPGLARVVAVEPADACAAVADIVPPGVDVIAQAAGTLGERMARVMGQLFERGADAVVLLGSDLPDLQPPIVARALALLAGEPDSLVLGPAVDGGYYLLAATRVPDVFEAIDWGTDRVLAQTVAAAGRCRMEVHLLPSMRDVDTPDDLGRVSAPRTAAWRRRNVR